MVDYTGIIFYSDQQVLLELDLGEDEKTLLPSIPGSGYSRNLSGSDLNKLRQKVRDKYQVEIDNPVPLLNQPYIVVGEWEDELSEDTTGGNRLMWVDLDEVCDVLTSPRDIKALKKFKSEFCEVTDSEHNPIGIATKQEVEKYHMYHQPLGR